MIDFPFDEAGRGPADDLARIQTLREEMEPTPTLTWLPLFLTEASLERLGRLVMLDHVLAGDRLGGFTTHLSPQDRVQDGHLLKNMADSLREHMHEVMRQAYGIDRPDEQWVRTDLPLRDQFPCLDPTLDVRPPTAPNLNDAFEQLLDQVMSHVYPAHPRFDEEVRLGDLRTALPPGVFDSSPVLTPAAATAGVSAADLPDSPHRAAARSRWARLLARIYEVFPLTCPDCGGDMRILAFITAAEHARKSAPSRAPQRPLPPSSSPSRYRIPPAGTVHRLPRDR